MNEVPLDRSWARIIETLVTARRATSCVKKIKSVIIRVVAHVKFFDPTLRSNKNY